MWKQIFIGKTNLLRVAKSESKFITKAMNAEKLWIEKLDGSVKIRNLKSAKIYKTIIN